MVIVTSLNKQLLYIERIFFFLGRKRSFLQNQLALKLVVCLLASSLLLWNQEASAGMYACRDRSGKINYTNVRNSASCSPLHLKKSKKARTYSPRSINRSSTRYDRHIKRIAGRYKVDPPLIKAIIYAESGFDHKAISRRGAQGLMQLMPETAREMRVANPFNPRDNIEGGTRYFRKMLDSFNNNLILSLAAYNAGPGLVKRTGGVPRIPETRKYVNKVLKQYKLYKARW